MIVFDLVCGGGHIFEAWFGSSADYDDQKSRKLLSCPMCGDHSVAKAVMAPSVGVKGNAAPANKPVPLRSSDGLPAPAEMKAMLKALAQAQAKALEGSEHVGARFASEARAMHEGDSPERPIHGQATIAEAKALVADGVPVAPLPLPLPPAGLKH